MRQRVLIADKDAGTREAIAALLARFDAEAIFADDDNQAYQLFVEQGPDVVFVDALLPRKGGGEVIRQIRQTDGGDRVAVFVTSALGGGGSLRDEAMGAWGALGFFPKPLHVDRVEAELGRILREPELEPEPVVVQPSGLAMVSPPDEGTFERSSFPALFASLLKRETPCRLAMGEGKMRKVVYFDAGAVTFISSNLFSETLARHMLDMGTVTEEQYREAIELVLRDKVRIGQAFRTIGAADAVTVDTAVRENIRYKISTLFDWKSGWYKVIPYAEPAAKIPGGPLNGLTLLWEEVSERVSAERAEGFLSQLGDEPLSTGRDGAELPDAAAVGKAAKRMAAVHEKGGKMTLAQAMNKVGSKGMSILYYLLIAGFLEMGRGEGEVADDKPMEPVDMERLAQTLKRLAWMRGRNHFQLLGVGVDCNDATLNEAYEELYGQLQPGDAPGLLRKALAETLELVTQAYESLKTAGKRSLYMESLRHGGDIPLQDGERVMRAEASFREGISAMEQNQWEEAAEKFGWAADLNPEESEYPLYLGMVRMRQGGPERKRRLAEAEKVLNRSYEMNPQNADCVYCLGRLARMRGDKKSAIDFMQSALSLDPNHQRAAGELESLGEKKPASVGGKLASLFGKKKRG